MRAVIPEVLWIGNARDAREVAEVIRAGFKAVVDLAMEEPAAVYHRDMVYCRLPLVDGEGNEPWLLRLAVHTVAQLVRGQSPTLVVCSRGLSRSPAVVAAAMASLNGQSMEEELQKLAPTNRSMCPQGCGRRFGRLNRPRSESDGRRLLTISTRLWRKDNG